MTSGPSIDLPPREAMPALRIGDPAPGFLARSTGGMVSLEQYRGGWLVFFSHPGDFTPVCTSEFVALAAAEPAFAAIGCSLLGHSVDSLFSHLAWLRAVRDRFGVTIPFPVVEDPDFTIARAYGMIAPEAQGAATVRALHVIDPAGIVRAIAWYPLDVGRSVAEILRLVTALQRADADAVVTPEGWQPGDPVLARPALLADEALAASSPSDWFYREIADRPA